MSYLVVMATHQLDIVVCISKNNFVQDFLLTTLAALTGVVFLNSHK